MKQKLEKKQAEIERAYELRKTEANKVFKLKKL